MRLPTCPSQPLHAFVLASQENLKISPAMLSRFDLTFLLLDRPDAERDARLTGGWVHTFECMHPSQTSLRPAFLTPLAQHAPHSMPL